MEVVILCGGKGTRLSEETITKPKPMVEIGGKPILWHIMKSYSNYGYKKFILALGYKGHIIKDFFYNARINQSDFTLKMDPLKPIVFHNTIIENDWEISFVDTGEETLKGGRLKKIEKHIKSDDFFVTYGDGVSNINLKSLYEFHMKSLKIATVSAVRPSFSTSHNNAPRPFAQLKYFSKKQNNLVNQSCTSDFARYQEVWYRVNFLVHR